MGRATRTFKLRLSPAGMDVLIYSHCQLIRTTRSLIAWGTTLHVAVDHLDTMPATTVADMLARLRASPLSGTEEHHVGAPHRLWDKASRIAAKVRSAEPDGDPPTLGSIYLLALQEMARADGEALLDAFERVKLPQQNRRCGEAEC